LSFFNFFQWFSCDPFLEVAAPPGCLEAATIAQSSTGKFVSSVDSYFADCLLSNRKKEASGMKSFKDAESRRKA
jgi:hypothetical protein